VAKFRITPHTDLSAMARWRSAAGEALTFIVSKNADFAWFAEGVAIGVVHSLRAAATRLEVECTYEVREPQRIGLGQLGLFGTLFGAFLAFAADSIQDSAGREIRSLVLDSIWTEVQQGQGAFGDGKRLNVVFRNPDAKVPEIIRGPGGEFGPRSMFSRLLLRSDKAFGLHVLDHTSTFGKCMQQFLYQASLNAHQHGSRDVNDESIRGVYGIAFEKAVFENDEDIDRRQHLHPIIKAYLRKNWEDVGNVRQVTHSAGLSGFIRGRAAVAITIADFGRGIHATLPSDVPGDGWQRLHLAFETKVSRLPAGSDRERGLGLIEVVKHATAAKVLLFVRSGSYFGYRDFSDESPRNQQDDPDAIVALNLRRWEGEVPTIDEGTSLTLVWPGTSGQLKLL
jgi:hypothetical protein